MSVHDQLFALGHRHHDQVLALLGDLEKVQAEHPDDRYPVEVLRLQAALWEWLKAFGRRDVHGVVDEEPAPVIKAWRPGDDDEVEP